MKIENAQNLSIQRAKKNNITGGLGEKKYHRSDETAFVQLLSAKVTLNNPIAIILVFGSSLLCVVPVGSTDTYTAPAPAHRAYTFTQNVQYPYNICRSRQKVYKYNAIFHCLVGTIWSNIHTECIFGSVDVYELSMCYGYQTNTQQQTNKKTVATCLAEQQRQGKERKEIIFALLFPYCLDVFVCARCGSVDILLFVWTVRIHAATVYNIKTHKKQLSAHSISKRSNQPLTTTQSSLNYSGFTLRFGAEWFLQLHNFSSICHTSTLRITTTTTTTTSCCCCSYRRRRYSR